MQISETSLCSFCQREDETIIHLFAQCNIVINLWSQLKSFFSSYISLPPLTPQSAFLGFYDATNKKIIINHILSTYKLVIYKSRNSEYCNLLKIINKIKQTKTIEDKISFMDDRKRVYNETKWSVIRFISD